VIPSTLPYTIPVSLLFAVTVVYGRLAGDNEIIAIKTAGLSVTTVLWPTFILAGGLSLLLLHLSGGWIPNCTHMAKLVLFKDLEDTFYKLLKRDRQFDNERWPFLIKVRAVEGKVMTDATFKHKDKENPGSFDGVIQAKRARLKFDLPAKMVRVFLEDAELQRLRHDADVFLINNRRLDIPIPPDSQFNMDKKIQEYTNRDLVVELANRRRLIATERKRQAILVGLGYASGLVEPIDWSQVKEAQINHPYWVRECNEFETEWHLRISMAVGSLVFVIVGAPVGILFAKRDFLSAFISCFLPIITLYYPLMLCGVNVSKEGLLAPLGLLAPVVSLWMGNLLLALMSLLVLPPVIRH
jgi:lipopolysaccharide export system permease protein